MSTKKLRIKNENIFGIESISVYPKKERPTNKIERPFTCVALMEFESESAYLDFFHLGNIGFWQADSQDTVFE